MENLTIPGTTCTPSVIFNIDGKLCMEGRSLPEDVNVFYNPLLKWIAELKTETVVFDISLEYFNSASSKRILDMLKTLDDNKQVLETTVIWHYEEGDEDNMESGQIFEELMQRTTFRFAEFAEVL